MQRHQPDVLGGIMKITGKHRNVSREFIRAWINASAAVLAHHNYPMDLATLRVRILDLSKMGSDVAEGNVMGWADRSRNEIGLSRKGSRETVASALLHECIHLACGSFGDDTDELCTSRLTAKLKPTVAILANTLQDDDNANRAHFAHTKIAYRNAAGEPDHYDDGQWVRVGATDKHGMRRKERKEEAAREANRAALFRQHGEDEAPVTEHDGPWSALEWAFGQRAFLVGTDQAGREVLFEYNAGRIVGTFYPVPDNWESGGDWMTALLGIETATEFPTWDNRGER